MMTIKEYFEDYGHKNIVVMLSTNSEETKKKVQEKAFRAGYFWCCTTNNTDIHENLLLLVLNKDEKEIAGAQEIDFSVMAVLGDEDNRKISGGSFLNFEDPPL